MYIQQSAMFSTIDSRPGTLGAGSQKIRIGSQEILLEIDPDSIKLEVDFDDIKPILDNVKTEPPDAGHQVTIF
jgi:hypothetical protein